MKVTFLHYLSYIIYTEKYHEILVLLLVLLMNLIEVVLLEAVFRVKNLAQIVFVNYNQLSKSTAIRMLRKFKLFLFQRLLSWI